MIECLALTKVYAEARVVDGVSFEVERGQLLALVGGSGSGKTTTLRMISRLIEPTSGTVRIDGELTSSLPGHLLRRGIGYVFQGIGLFPHLSVAQNIGITPALLGWSKPRIAERVRELLALVELPLDIAARPPRALSGGQQQRVAVARALAAHPKVLLLDEPFGALDPITRDRLQSRFRTLQQELGLTAIFVTHDMTEALVLADRIAVMQAGRVIQIGSPRELLSTPAHDYVAQLFEAPRRQADRFEALRMTSGRGA
jgi:osmoprotectant transport system ATP-binding protein